MSRVFDPSKFEPIESEVNHSIVSSEQKETVTVVSNKPSYMSDKYLIDLSKAYPEIEYTLQINGINTFPKGDLQAIKAKAKQGKTHVNICLTTALLRGEFLAIKSLIDDPKVCYFATEEQNRSVQKNNRKVHKLCGWDTGHSDERFKVYALREVETTERITIIEEVIKAKEPEIVFIDGIRDLLIDFNNIQQSHEIISRLLRLSGTYNCAIVCVLHTNKSSSDFNMRGHLGTELLNKSSDVLEVEKTDSNFIVRHSDSRNMETGMWAFCFDEEGLLKEGEVQDKRQGKAEQRTEKMEACFSKILNEDKILSHADLGRKYMALSGYKIDAATKHIGEMTDRGFIKKREDGRYELA